MSMRMSTLILVVSLSLSGLPRPASAAGDTLPAGAHRRGLTINGQPLANLLNTTATAAWSLSGLEQRSGQIRGVTLDPQGRALVDQAVELLRVSDQGKPAETVGTTTTGRDGGFSFSGLAQGRYTINTVIDGQVDETSEVVSLAPSEVIFIRLGGPALQAATDNTNGKGALFWTAVGAGAGFGVGLVADASGDCGDSCGIAPVGLAITGALMGLLFGAGR